MAKDEQEQGADQLRPHIWVAAEYHFPSTYSCRIPLSSENNPLAMPAPGPAPVRLALIHAGIELFGREVVRDTLFPIIRSAPVRVRPPECVAISQQVLQAYKWSENRETREVIQQESIIMREMAHVGAVQFVDLLPGSEQYSSASWRILHALSPPLRNDPATAILLLPDFRISARPPFLGGCGAH